MQPRIVYTDGPIDLRKPRDGKKYMHMFPNFGPFAGKTDEGTSKKFRFFYFEFMHIHRIISLIFLIQN